jgi:glucose/arabinose dehydrogenase
VVARDLEVPWDIVFLPDEGFLVSERPGRLLRLSPGGMRMWSVQVPGVRARGEGGLLGLALHPRFAENRWLYVYLTAGGPSGVENRVDRYRVEETGIGERTTILSGIPAGHVHNGGRIAFGPDGFLYITTGDAGDGDRSQDESSLGGKVLRVTDGGEIPADNPFGTPVHSLGHRNPQGLAWDDEGRLWSTEHGRSGLSSGLDELNRIEKGVNYGWPLIQGDQSEGDMRRPVLHSGPDVTWAPSGTAFRQGSLFFGGLRGEALYQVRLTPGGDEELVVHFFRELGRIRAVKVGPDGMLYLSTSNRDGRGRAREGDDRIVRVDLAVFR